MNAGEFFERLAALEGGERAFALAMVVDRKAPVSSHLGDRAIVFEDGRMEGFVGGSCSRDIVRRQALDAIAAGRPRVVRIDPSGDGPRGDGETEHVFVPMGCASEGGVDIYIEPHLPPRPFVVAGFSPVADALVRLASALDGYRVVRVTSREELRDVPPGANAIALDELPAFLEKLAPASRARLVAVVASQGHYDESALEALVAADGPFTGLLASRRRGAAVLAALAQAGVTHERLERVHTPVGIALGARTPGEVAVSILAELVVAVAPSSGVAVAEFANDVTDPVCGMTVDLGSAMHRLVHGGRTYVFCCASCRGAFEADPASFEAVGRRL